MYQFRIEFYFNSNAVTTRFVHAYNKGEAIELAVKHQSEAYDTLSVVLQCSVNQILKPKEK